MLRSGFDAGRIAPTAANGLSVLNWAGDLTLDFMTAAVAAGQQNSDKFSQLCTASSSVLHNLTT
jgi:hypothetical protein